MQNTIHFEHLPSDIIENEIFPFLNSADLESIQLVNKNFFQKVQNFFYNLTDEKIQILFLSKIHLNKNHSITDQKIQNTNFTHMNLCRNTQVTDKAFLHIHSHYQNILEKISQKMKEENKKILSSVSPNTTRKKDFEPFLFAVDRLAFELRKENWKKVEHHLPKQILLTHLDLSNNHQITNQAIRRMPIIHLNLYKNSLITLETIQFLPLERLYFSCDSKIVVEAGGIESLKTFLPHCEMFLLN